VAFIELDRKERENNLKYKVLRDTREQKGWSFSRSENCEGTVDVKLPTGDYTLEGFSNLFVIERKGSTGEFARNIVENRFEEELTRLELFPHPFIILEFTAEDIVDFPKRSGIPTKQWPKLKIGPWFLLKRLVDFDIAYKTKIILAGTKGKEIAASIFKRIIERYGEHKDAKAETTRSA
jgi:ERCC4-type nuclease